MTASGAQPTWASRLLRNVDMGRIATDIRRFEQDDRWLQENIDRFRKEFSGMFVAVHDRKLIGAGKTLRDTQDKARSAGINPEKCVIQLILAEDPIWAL